MTPKRGVGNRRKRTVNVTPELSDALKTKSYQYDANDWLGTTLNLGKHSATADNNGNTLRADLDADGDWDQNADDLYDFENRLTLRTLSDKSIEIVYDGDGNRAKKVIRNNAGNVINATFYLVDSRNPSGYAQVVEEFENNSATPPAEALRILTRRYIHGHDLLYQELNDNHNPPVWSRHYYGYDGHGNTRFLMGVGSGGAVSITDTYTYDAFGNLIEQWRDDATPTPNNYLYCGEQFDVDLGLYFLRARYLHTDSGRFWTMDGFDGLQTDPHSLHKYVYAHANPVNRIDPSGHLSFGELLVVSGVGSIIGALSAAAAAEAEGRAVTMTEIFVSAAAGAILAPAAALYTPLAVGLGIGGVVYSGLSFGPILANQHATPAEKRAATVLIAVSLMGGAQSWAAFSKAPIQVNNAKGLSAEDSFGAAAQRFGWRDLGSGIRVRSPFHQRGRVMDRVLEHPQTKELYGFELKSTHREFNELNIQQNAADTLHVQVGGRPAFGTRARAAGVEGKTIRSITKLEWPAPANIGAEGGTGSLGFSESLDDFLEEQ